MGLICILHRLHISHAIFITDAVLMQCQVLIDMVVINACS